MSRDDLTAPPDRREPDVRRRQILADALRAADRRRRTRAMGVFGVGAGAAVTLAVVVGTILTVSRRDGTSGGELAAVTQPVTRPLPAPVAGHDPAPPVPPPTAPAPPVPPEPGVIVEVVRDEPGSRTWQTLSDDELLAELAAVGD